MASDWLRHFQLLLWNCRMEFNETWQEARSQRPLPSLCFSGQSEKQDGRPGLWLAETFSTSPLKPLNGIQQNLTGSKISMSSTKFVFFGTISKQKCPSWPISQRGGTLYSAARYVALWASCYLRGLYFRVNSRGHHDAKIKSSPIISNIRIIAQDLKIRENKVSWICQGKWSCENKVSRIISV